MTEPGRKRKATEQASPYSQEPEEPNSSLEYPKGDRRSTGHKAKAKKAHPSEKPSLKGIFGNVSLREEENQAEAEKDDLIAGLNNSFLEAIRTVLKKQSNRDLRYLFEQYNRFMEDIEENNK